LYVLAPGQDEDYGPALVLGNLPDLPVGPYKFGASLLDPITGASIARSNAPFKIFSGPQAAASHTRRPAPLAIEEVRQLTLTVEDHEISTPDLAIRNADQREAVVEVKVWLDAPEHIGPAPIAALAVAGDLSLAGGSSIRLDLASAVRELTLAPGSYTLNVRLLEPATGIELARRAR